MQSAIDEGRIKAAYQAIFSAKTMKIAKYEVLIRLIDRAGKSVSPGEFLPAVKRTNVYGTWRTKDEIFTGCNLFASRLRRK